MDCPQCGGQLVDYRLGDRAAVGCEDCGYVGIDAEHRGRSTERESWDDALERFYRRRGPPSADDERSDGEDTASADDALDAAAPGADDETDGRDATTEESARDVDPEHPTMVNGSVERATDDGDDDA
ncbi:MAG: hypothetical protein ABEJ43_05735 [Haloferacaceae archaeon]